MPTVTVPRMVRPGAGYATIADRWGVTPDSIVVNGATTVTFPEPVEGDPILDLEAVAEWLITHDDEEMAQRATIRAAFATLEALPALPEEPTAEQVLEHTMARCECMEAVLRPLVQMTLGVPTTPEA